MTSEKRPLPPIVLEQLADFQSAFMYGVWAHAVDLRTLEDRQYRSALKTQAESLSTLPRNAGIEKKIRKRAKAFCLKYR